MSKTDAQTDLEMSVPRKPRFFKRTGHLLDRLEDPVRPIRDDMVEDAIRNGDVGENLDRDTDVTWRFIHEIDGVNVIVVVEEDQIVGQDLRLVTAFCEVTDYDTATADWTRWSTHDVDVMVLLATLTGDPRDGKELEDVGVDYPVNYHDHRLVCYSSESAAYCVTCRKVGESKRYFEAAPCKR